MGLRGLLEKGAFEVRPGHAGLGVPTGVVDEDDEEDEEAGQTDHKDGVDHVARVDVEVAAGTRLSGGGGLWGLWEEECAHDGFGRAWGSGVRGGKSCVAGEPNVHPTDSLTADSQAVSHSEHGPEKNEGVGKHDVKCCKGTTSRTFLGGGAEGEECKILPGKKNSPPPPADAADPKSNGRPSMCERAP